MATTGYYGSTKSYNTVVTVLYWKMELELFSVRLVAWLSG